MQRQTLRALVVSPSASHPRDYGNRNRVWQTTSFLKRLGYDITFVLYPLETDWARGIPPSYADMKEAWSDVIVIPPSMPLHQRARGAHHEIDEWWDPEIGHYLSWLFQRQFFDVIFVNYSYLSRALELAPRNTIKVLDTHDLFAGRKELLAQNDVAPEFFYTTAEQERIAFDRADIILAIKDSEREAIRAMTRRTVLSLPFYPADLPAAASPGREVDLPALRRPAGDTELVVGFIGAENSVNIVNISRFLTEMGRLVPIYTPSLRIVIAGNVCRGLWSDNPAVRLVGPVENINDFYDAVDVVVVPLSFSTGIKIKVGEALAYGKPVVATANGFDGYPAFDPFHRLPDVPSACRALIKLACDPPRLALLAEHTMMAARMAGLATSGSLESLAQALHNRVRRIVFVTDKPFWRRDTLWHERLYQWYELMSYLAPTICLAIGDYPDASLQEPGSVQGTIIAVEPDPPGGDPTSLERALRDLLAPLVELGQLHCIISVRQTLAAEVETAASEHGNTLVIDSWGDADLAGDDGDAELLAFAGGVPDLSLQGAAMDPLSLSTAPLRYIPHKLAHWAAKSEAPHIVVVLCSADPAARRELELLLPPARRAVGRVTVVGRTGDPLADVDDAEFLSWAATVGRISTLLLVGSDLRMRRLYHAAAGYLEIPCEEAALERFPFLHRDAGGQTELVHSTPQLLRRILSHGSGVSPSDTHDAGWSRIWQILEAA
ncbi:MAG TPA: glycosyltransferase [Stellaceae bacterium]|nr:glycosyltransferase [Stellaceae bacterium]